MAAALSETRETPPKPFLKDAGATHQPQHLSTETLGDENLPPSGEVSPRFVGAEALRRFRRFKGRKASIPASATWENKHGKASLR